MFKHFCEKGTITRGDNIKVKLCLTHFVVRRRNKCVQLSSAPKGNSAFKLCFPATVISGLWRSFISKASSQGGSIQRSWGGTKGTGSKTGKSCEVIVLRAESLGGRCNAKRATIRTLTKMGLLIRGKRFITIMKASKSKGSALLRVLNKLSQTASNGICISNGSVFTLGSRRLAVFHEEGVKFIFRSFGLIPILSICRGVILPLRLSKGAISGTFVKRVTRTLKLGRGLGILPGRLSKKRRRHITVTQTLTTGPTVLLTSRPAKGLSDYASRSIVKLLGAADAGFSRAVIVVARGRRVTRLTSQVVHVRSKQVIAKGTNRTL